MTAMSKAFGAKVSLVRVAQSQDRQAEAREYLGQMGERLRQEGVSSVEDRVLSSEPAGALLDMLQNSPHAMVTMTRPGRSGLERWVLGSVTDRAVRYSGAPVLVVR